MNLPEWAMKIKFKPPLPHYVTGDIEHGFFCRICRKHYTGGDTLIPWITIACTNQNKQAITRHEVTGVHNDNCRNEVHAADLSTTIRSSALPNFVTLRKQLRTCEYIVKNKIPIPQYEDLIQLQIRSDQPLICRRPCWNISNARFVISGVDVSVVAPSPAHSFNRSHTQLAQCGWILMESMMRIILHKDGGHAAVLSNAASFQNQTTAPAVNPVF